jgi:hypothetical protein
MSLTHALSRLFVLSGICRSCDYCDRFIGGHVLSWTRSGGAYRFGAA